MISFVSSYPDKKDPFFSIEAALPGFSESYGLLTGPAFTLPYAFLLLFAGLLTDAVPSRALLLGFSSLGWSVCTLAQGFAHNVTTLFLARLGLGIFQAGCGAPAYSLIADYFPPERRTTANSIYSLGIYIGQSLSSLTILLIGQVGWRCSFWIVGGIGIGCAVLALIGIREPKRGRFDVDIKHENPKLAFKK